MRRRLAAALVVLGATLALGAELAWPALPAPLFDGLLVEDPYRFVDPPSGGAGDPPSARVDQQVVAGAVPLLAVSTNELPPQAQMIAEADAFALPAGATSISVSITPIAPDDSAVLGNVYRFAVVDQAGTAVTINPDALVTIVMRTPLPQPGAQIAQFDGSGWVPLQTEHGGLPDLFATNIVELGDYAVIGPAAASPPAASASQVAVPPSASPAPSAGDGQPSGGGGPPWVVIAFAIAAFGVGLGWGLLSRDEGP